MIRLSVSIEKQGRQTDAGWLRADENDYLSILSGLGREHIC